MPRVDKHFWGASTLLMIKKSQWVDKDYLGEDHLNCPNTILVLFLFSGSFFNIIHFNKNYLTFVVVLYGRTFLFIQISS